ncbi:type II secretion system protein GspD [Pseudomonas daroniae]|nr:type II secretion system secretin GspD [Pseudomonas daroniae]TBU74080.1 type II secretion system protein GspD [Pseudomonas daroniae]
MKILSRFILGLFVLVSLWGCTSPVDKDNGKVSIINQGLSGVGSLSMPNTRFEALSSNAEEKMPSGHIVHRPKVGFSALQEGPDHSQSDMQGEVVFNFSGQPIDSVIHTVLGDLLGENYSIAPGVAGEVTFSTAKPVGKKQAFTILETLLSWTNNAIVRKKDGYLVLPVTQVVAGQLTPKAIAPAPREGYAARLFALNYISAIEMHKLIKPFARDSAFLLVDSARNVLILSGTSEELANYERTIDMFDVNWLSGMSFGIYPIHNADVRELLPEIERIFRGQEEVSAVGVVRFIPIERTNSIVAIASQPEYLREVERWVDIIDQDNGNEPAIHVYDVKNMRAVELAGYLRQMYGGEGSKEEGGETVAPGLRTLTLTSDHGIGGPPGALSQEGLKNPRFPGLAESETSSSMAQDRILGSVRIAAQKNSNQLLVRSRPAQWKEIKAAIHKLDHPPVQVQIETRILEVSLTGALSLGVQWYLGRLAGNSSADGVENTPGGQGAIGQGGAALNGRDALFYSFLSSNLQVALRALETNGNTKVLSAPSLVVMNNQEAQIQVGDNIPINQTTINLDNTSISTSSVQYVQTGVILGVVPRISPNGLVYMDIQQQVSSAGIVTDPNGNPTISTRAVSTQVAVRDGQTILLGGLIQQSEVENENSVPFLGRVPGLGWLFGNIRKGQERSELIVLITPRVVYGDSGALEVTEQYRQRLQLMQPGVDR